MMFRSTLDSAEGYRGCGASAGALQCVGWLDLHVTGNEGELYTVIKPIMSHVLHVQKYDFHI